MVCCFISNQVTKASDTIIIQGFVLFTATVLYSIVTRLTSDTFSTPFLKHMNTTHNWNRTANQTELSAFVRCYFRNAVERQTGILVLPWQLQNHCLPYFTVLFSFLFFIFLVYFHPAPSAPPAQLMY